MPAVRGARPIRNREVLDFHNKLNNVKIPTLTEYERVWREWLNFSKHKSLVLGKWSSSFLRILFLISVISIVPLSRLFN